MNSTVWNLNGSLAEALGWMSGLQFSVHQSPFCSTE